MKNPIIQTGPATFELRTRGARLTLKASDCPNLGAWVVYTDSAATRAYNAGRESSRFFPSLAAVEGHYKSFRGVAALIEG